MRKQSGFALIDVIVGAAVFSVVVLSVAQLSALVSTISMRSKRVIEFGKIVTEINSILSNESSCRLALGGPSTLNGALVDETRALLSNQPTDVTLYVPAAAGGARPVYLNSTAGTNRIGQWRALSVQLTPLSLLYAVPQNVPPPPPPGPLPQRNIPARLNIVFTADGVDRRQSAEINVSVSLDGADNIVSCSKLNFGTDQFAAPVCGPNQALYSDGTRLGCRTVRCIPPIVGPSLGWNPDGSIRCP